MKKAFIYTIGLLITLSSYGQTKIIHDNYLRVGHHSALSISSVGDTVISLGSARDIVDLKDYVLLHKSYDNGVSWLTEILDTLPLGYLNFEHADVSVAKNDPLRVYLGINKLIYHTIDGGVNWIKDSLTISGKIIQITTSVGNTENYILTSKGEILKGGNGTINSWSVISALPNNTYGYSSLSSVNTTHVVGRNDGTLFISTDGGITWSPNSLLTSFVQRKISIACIDNQIWYIYDDYNSSGAQVLKTVDGGASFSQVSSGFPNPFYQRFFSNGISFSDLNHGAAISQTGDIAITKDGGSTWSFYTHTPTTIGDSLTSIVIKQDGNIFLTTLEGEILKLDNSLVWPGDANSDGTANIIDILPIGVGYGSIGPVRSAASLNWVGQTATDFGTTFANGVDYKHADCNGDGTINQNDLSAILLNYGLTHSKGDLNQNYILSNPDLRVELSTDSSGIGTLVTASIKLGDLVNTADTVYGVTFSLNFDPTLVDSAQMTVEYSASWLGNISSNSDFISLDTTLLLTGRLDVGMTRTNQINKSGSGEVCSIEIFTTDDLIGKQTIYETLKLTLSNVKIIRLDETEMSVNTISDSIVIIQADPLSRQNITENLDLNIYPNPSNGEIKIAGNFKKTDMSILNSIGQTVYSENVLNGQTIDMNSFPKGVYFIRFIAKGQSEVIKLVLK